MLYSRWTLRSTGSFRFATRAARKRGILTLAIETSADDTAVAIVEKQSDEKNKPRARIRFHEKITANNAEFKGIHPRNSAVSHQTELPGLIRRALRYLPEADQDDGTAISVADCERPLRKPTFISATRGPGMRAGLSTGLDMAKGLCLAYDIPFIGVHHMQAHALTPRLVSALSSTPDEAISPAFPFRSLLVSGGHTLLVNGITLEQFEEEITTLDTAAGDCVDKMAKHILPPSVLDEHQTDTNYGAALESFAFPNGESDYNYTPPKDRGELLAARQTRYGWAVPPPLQSSAKKAFSFAGLDSSVRRIALQGSARLSETRNQLREVPMDLDERLELARHAQRVLFEHIADRIYMVLRPTSPSLKSASRTSSHSLSHQLAVSGGVASNKFFRHLLHAFLASRGVDVQLVFPPISLCTDNAAMIAWAGIEMWDAGWRSEMDCISESQWPLAGERGLIGIGGWHREL